jgi:hypothetical protein
MNVRDPRSHCEHCESLTEALAAAYDEVTALNDKVRLLGFQLVEARLQLEQERELTWHFLGDTRVSLPADSTHTVRQQRKEGNA